MTAVPLLIYMLDVALSHSFVDSEGCRQISVMDDSTAVIFVEALDDVYNLLGHAMRQDSPNRGSVHHVKCLFEVNKIDIQW